MSDLQCAATLLLVPRSETKGLAVALSGARVVHVWSAPTEAARRAAGALAADLGVGISAHAELHGPTGLDAALADIADQHRGETAVVVVDDGEAILEIAIDGDGWTRRRWTPVG